MPVLQLGVAYGLRVPDGRELGTIQIERIEDGWAEGPFAATAEFEPHRTLFEREALLRYDQVIGLWERAADEIEVLGIQAVATGADEAIPAPRVCIEGSEAIIRVEAGQPATVNGVVSSPTLRVTKSIADDQG